MICMIALELEGSEEIEHDMPRYRSTDAHHVGILLEVELTCGNVQTGGQLEISRVSLYCD